ncbi:MAG TPA: hypothetical protein PKM12_10300 [Marmoricola sp.]|nr:hypothetical protein [Marmoricola sp.]HNN49363.1 hypothetical protein [Marmoricola sp.]
MEHNPSPPGWFWILAIGSFPASIALVILISYLLPRDLSDEAVNWWVRKGFYYIPIAGGIIMMLTLWYGAQHY